jgi:hypothetical protein
MERSALVYQGAPDPGRLTYSDQDARKWAWAKVRLGWILQGLLERDAQLFSGCSTRDRMHAAEAALFMIGYDVRCIPVPALTENDIADATASRANESRQQWAGCATLGRRVEFEYAELANGDLRLRVGKTRAQFGIAAAEVDSIVQELAGRRMPIGASRTAPSVGSFGRWLADDGRAIIGRDLSGYTSYIAALLCSILPDSVRHDRGKLAFA